MARKILISMLSVFLFAFAACDKNVSETKPQNVETPTTTVSPVTAPAVPKDGNYDGTGTVTKINNEGGSIEINHEKIKDLMPAMQMEFFVKDKALLKGLVVGDRVDFVLEYKHPGEIIVSLKKAQ